MPRGENVMIAKLTMKRLSSAVLLAGVGLSTAWAQADTTPPVIGLTESGAPLVDGALFGRAVTPVIAVTDDSPVTVEALLDGAPSRRGRPSPAKAPMSWPSPRPTTLATAPRPS